MDRLLVVNFSVCRPGEHVSVCEGEKRITAPLKGEPDLTLDGAVRLLVEAHPWAAEALAEWVERNRAFTARALERRPWEEGLEASAIVYDRCHAGAYGLDVTQDGSDVYSHLDSLEAPLMSIHYLIEQSPQEHKALAQFVVDSMNAAWRKENGPIW